MHEMLQQLMTIASLFLLVACIVLGLGAAAAATTIWWEQRQQRRVAQLEAELGRKQAELQAVIYRVAEAIASERAAASAAEAAICRVGADTARGRDV